MVVLDNECSLFLFINVAHNGLISLLYQVCSVFVQCKGSLHFSSDNNFPNADKGSRFSKDGFSFFYKQCLYSKYTILCSRTIFEMILLCVFYIMLN